MILVDDEVMAASLPQTRQQVRSLSNANPDQKLADLEQFKRHPRRRPLAARRLARLDLNQR
jgi:hypothetical protein